MNLTSLPPSVPRNPLPVISSSERTPKVDVSNPLPSVLGPPPVSNIKRRSPIACRRCRRMRSKCVHEKGNPPCKACADAGLPAVDCIFPVRGQPDSDRDYRHPRLKAEKAIKRETTKTRRDLSLPSHGRLGGSVISEQSTDEWEFLPPLPEIVEAVNNFTLHYFQLGFIPKQLFSSRLTQNHRSVSVFLLLSILSISARFTSSLARRHGSAVRAAELFMESASNMAMGEVYAHPTLERCQAFYLLSIAQQGSGWKNRSYINMGIAIRMAILMQLHREETYRLDDPTAELIIRAESARRTLWMLHSQDNLHSGPLSPVSLVASDITALLPSDEDDFAKGTQPKSRAALEGTPPAIEDPSRVADPNRSLFASLIQIHHYWGHIARRAVNHAKSPCPWEPMSDFAKMTTKLASWESQLPNDHLWSRTLLMGYKAKAEDLAYLGVTMMTRLCNIVIRRPYLNEIIRPTAHDRQQQPFYTQLSRQLFANVRALYEQIELQFACRTPDESVGAQMAAFCVYSCGLFSTYLVKYPRICPDEAISRDGPVMLQRAMSILMECKKIWPLAARWLEALEKFSRDPKASALSLENSMADGRDPVPRALSGASGLPSPSSVPRLRVAPHEESKSYFKADTTPPTTTPTPAPAMILPPLNTTTDYSPRQFYLTRHEAPGVNLLHDTSYNSYHHRSSPHHSVATEDQPLESSAYYSPASSSLGPGNDGYEGELQFYIDGTQPWGFGEPGLFRY